MAELRRRRSVSQAHLLSLFGVPARRPGNRGMAPARCGRPGWGHRRDRHPAGWLAAHRVTVVDPSPDALASLERRTAEAELTGRITGAGGRRRRSGPADR